MHVLQSTAVQLIHAYLYAVQLILSLQQGSNAEAS